MDGVLVEYEGRLADGTVFDDSARHGGPQPMIAGQVIPGFSEALMKMQKGGKYKIHIPGKLAYGESPPPGSPFGPNADLDFDVHIVQIVPNAALMNQGGEIPGQAQQRGWKGVRLIDAETQEEEEDDPWGTHTETAQERQWRE